MEMVWKFLGSPGSTNVTAEKRGASGLPNTLWGGSGLGAACQGLSIPVIHLTERETTWSAFVLADQAFRELTSRGAGDT